MDVSPVKKVLIVEDHAPIRALIRAILETEGAQIHEAEDAHSGWEAAVALKPDLVFLDVMMPGDLHGLDLCRALRATPAMSGCRIVIVSALGNLEDKQDARCSGAQDYVCKPFSADDILRAFRSTSTAPALSNPRLS